MRKVFVSVVLAALGLVSFSATNAADKPTEKTKADAAFCPVAGIGQAINKDIAVEFEGGKVYFSSEKSAAEFKKDSTKFATKARHQLLSTGQLEQTGCPFSGGPVKAENKLDVAGVDVGFCCAGCKGKVAKAAKPEAMIDIAFKDTSKGFKPAKKATK